MMSECKYSIYADTEERIHGTIRSVSLDRMNTSQRQHSQDPQPQSLSFTAALKVLQ